jgi:hypothetical protein
MEENKKMEIGKKEEIRNEADLYRIAMGSLIRQKYEDMEYEFERWSQYNMPMTYGAMQSLHSMARAQARGYPDLLKKYDEEVKELDKNKGSINERRWEMRPDEARERKELLENLLYDLGPTRMDERPEPSESVVYNHHYAVDGRQLVYDLFQTRLSENRNLVLLFTGQVGGGKSWGSLSVADYLTPSMKTGFSLEGLVFDIPSFIKHVRQGNPGDVIILDEAGVAAGSRDSLTKASKSLGKVIQSIRYLQYCTIFSVPNVNFLDRQIRLMVDLVFQHDENMKQGEFWVMIPKLTDDGKEVEYVRMKKGNNVIGSVFFPTPRPALVQDYEKKRREHNMEQLSDLQKDLEGDDRSESDMRGKNPNSLKNLKQFKEGE